MWKQEQTVISGQLDNGPSELPTKLLDWLWFLVSFLLDEVQRLKAEVKRLEAALRLERAQRFGESSERQSTDASAPESEDGTPSSEPEAEKAPSETEQVSETSQPAESPDALDEEASSEANGAGKRRRGGQPGHKGNGRKIPPHLPREERLHELPEDEQRCPTCGTSYQETTLTEDSEEIEIKVVIKVIRHRRKRYRSDCQCGTRFVTAPLPPKVIPKGKFTAETWAKFLIDKYQGQVPVTRQIKLLEPSGLTISKGTIHGGFKKLYEYLLPLYEHFRLQLQQVSHLHADETRWRVFEEVEGKANHRWWLWVFASQQVVFFVVDPSRSAKVPKKTLGFQSEKNAAQKETVNDNNQALKIISADRYRVYPAISDNVDVAFCWSHQRRDFVNFSKAHRNQPEMVAWAEDWLDDIGNLYAINKQRLAVRDQPELFQQAQARLETAIKAFHEKSLAREDTLTQAQIKVLESTERHWSGLIIFVSNPDVPMDNNWAERLLRTPVLGRKNYYGNQSQWAGELSAIMFSLIETCLLHQVNPYEFLVAYFEACAQHGKAPDDLTPFSPWLINNSRQSGGKDGFP